MYVRIALIIIVAINVLATYGRSESDEADNGVGQESDPILGSSFEA